MAMKIRREVTHMLRLGLPLIAAQVVQMAMGFVDTIMAGNFNAVALAAVAVGNSLYMPLLIFTLGVLLVINPIVAQLLGAGKKKRIGENLWQILWLSVFLSIAGWFILRNMRSVLEFFNIEPEIIPIAQGYLEAISWGLPAAFAYSALRYVNEGLHVTKPGMYFALFGLVINIFANYVLMYGHLGFPALGAVGTGWATALVMWAMLLCMALFTFRKESCREFMVRQGFRRPVWSFQKEILRIGIPNGVSLGIEVSMFAVAALIIGSMGISSVAAHQVTINFAALAFMVPLGLSFAISARVGFAVGKNDLATARFIGFNGIGLAGFFMCITATLMLTIPELIIGMYTSDPEVTEIAIKLLFLAAVFQLSDGLQVSGLAALRGLKDTKIPMFVNVVAYWVVGLPSGYILGIHYGYGPEGLWVGLILGLSVAAVLHNVRFHLLTRGTRRVATEP
ncbi:MATE family efflux transporter [bacterium]|nr:MATE family efflux transporter [bacterium]